MNALLLSVGGTPDPLIKSINEFNPDLIYFICSDDTVAIINKVLDGTNFSGETRQKITSDSDSLHKTFEIAFEAIKEIQNENYDVSIDFTGGTKPMTAALVLAAVGSGSEYFYVGSKDKNKGRDKEGVGIVKSGYEKIKKQEDPYEIFAIAELNRAKIFFDNYQFGASLKNFESAENKLEDEKLKFESQIYFKIVQFYDIWDKFNDESDILKDDDISGDRLDFYLKNLINKIEENNWLYEKIEENNPNFLNQMKNNQLFLNDKLSNKNKEISLKIRYYLPDLLNNVKRRIEERKFDDAVARLYRATELISQIKLHELDVIYSEKLKSNKVFHIVGWEIIILNF